MQRQPSKAAAVLLALLEEDNELTHARSRLAIHDDMTKARVVCSMRQILLNPFAQLVWCLTLKGQFEVAKSSSVHCFHMASAAATDQVSGLCAVVTSESYEASRVSSVKPSQASVAPGLIGRLPQCTCNEGDRHECDRHEGFRHECDRHEGDRHEGDRHLAWSASTAAWFNVDCASASATSCSQWSMLTYTL